MHSFLHIVIYTQYTCICWRCVLLYPALDDVQQRTARDNSLLPLLSILSSLLLLLLSFSFAALVLLYPALHDVQQERQGVGRDELLLGREPVLPLLEVQQADRAPEPPGARPEEPLAGGPRALALCLSCSLFIVYTIHVCYVIIFIHFCASSWYCLLYSLLIIYHKKHNIL